MKYSPNQMATDLQTIQIGLPDFPKIALKIKEESMVTQSNEDNKTESGQLDKRSLIYTRRGNQ